MSSFSAGFSARQDAAAQARQQQVAQATDGFAPADLKARAASGRADGGNAHMRPKSFAPQGAPNPKSFSPADPDHDATQGWDPLDPDIDSNGFVDPIAAARAAGFAEGSAHAQALAREEQERNIALLQSITHALGQAGRIDREALARQLRQAVVSLVTKLVGEIGISGDLLAKRIDAATDLLADSAESAVLRVNPEDVALLTGKLPDTIFPVGDSSVERGGFVLESASTIVEEGPELWIDQLTQAIDRVAVPTC